MDIYRTIRTSFWSDRKVYETFTAEDRYFFIYLMTNEHTNILGCYELGILQASREMGYSEETIKGLLKRFEEVHKVIEYDYTTGEVLILNWHKHNWNKSPKLKAAIDKQKKDIKSQGFRDYIDRVLIGYGYGIDTHTSTRTRSNTNTNTNSITNTNPYSLEGYQDYKGGN